MTLPEYSNLDLANCQLYHGYYTLGLIKEHRPDIEIVTFKLARRDKWNSADVDVGLLKSKVDSALSQNKIVLFVPWEEDVMGEKNHALTDFLNLYKDQPLYFVSEMNPQGQLLFKTYHEFECKILELPFVLVNDCVCYSQIRPMVELPEPKNSNYNFLCMIGRPEGHKYDLAKCLINHKLDQFGLITMGRNNLNLPPNDQLPRYQRLLTEHRKEAAQIEINGIWASSNVENFFHIERNYDMPLIIQPETTMGIFPATEKSIWPALLGRMYLIQGHAGIMSYVQQFHEVDQSCFADLKFDNVAGWDDTAHWHRRNSMIEDNVDLITNAREIYQTIKPDLEQARYKFAENMYNFFKNQLDKIKL